MDKTDTRNPSRTSSFLRHPCGGAEVRQAFGPGQRPDKHQIAEMVARYFPELASRLPKRREFWLPEDPRMSIFDAVALGFQHFNQQEIQH